MPDVAIGRLVETPAEITHALANYDTFDGQLDPQTALSTGYDFLRRRRRGRAGGAARRTCRPAARSASSDESDTWTAAALDDALSGRGRCPRRTSPRSTPTSTTSGPCRPTPTAADVEDNLYTTDDVHGDTTGRPRASRCCSRWAATVACRSATSRSAASAPPTGRRPSPGAGAVFAGNTGYGYGDDAVVGATEDLMVRFARHLDGSLTVGQAMALAKQQYVSATRVSLTPFDEKVVAQVVVYGLPQYRVGDETPAAADVRHAGAATPRSASTRSTVTLGDQFSLQPPPTSRPSGAGTTPYAGDIQTTAGQPVQPRAIVDVTADEPARPRRPHHRADVDERGPGRSGVLHAGGGLGRDRARGQHHADDLPDPAADGQPVPDADRTP